MTPHDVPSVRQIRIFAAIAASQSISGAAKAVNLSQPGVTQSVRALEERVGAELFERRGSGCYLTTSGAILLPRVQRFFDQLRVALSDIGPARSTARRLWMSPSTGSPARKFEA
jgi:molybdate transport repressor ModE-like protein